MPQKRATQPNPTKELAGQLLSALEERQRQGTHAPCSLRELGRGVRADVTEEELLAAARVAPFKPKAVFAFANDVESPVALKDDKERLAGDERLLHTLLERLCSPAMPLVEPKDLAESLDTSLKAAFKKVWGDHLKKGTLPEFVRVVKHKPAGTKTAKPVLHDVRFALPWEAVSRRLVDALAGWRDGLPTLAQLVASLSPPVDAGLVEQAVASAPYSDEVSPVFPKSPGSPVFRHSTEAAVVLRPEIVRRVVEASLTHETRAIPAAKLPPKNLLDGRLVKPLQSALDEAVKAGRLPAGVGAVRIKQWHLFLLEDMIGAPARGASSPSAHQGGSTSAGNPLQPSASSQSAPSADRFAADFEAAFARLDAAAGHRNFLKLYDLRRELSQYSREEFDAGLNQLRRARRYTLESSEGSLVALTAEELAARVVEGGSSLVYCRMLR